jgi:Domain of unknown function (DUF4349)
MRTADPLEPEVEAALEAIDATLAGDPVDPSQAELAELALILRADRPPVREPFAATLDARVRERFTPGKRSQRLRRGRGWMVWAPAAALAAAALVVVLAVFVPSGGSNSNHLAGQRLPTASSAGGSASSSGGPASAGSSAESSTSTSAASSAAPPTAPTGGNRQVVQSARLALSTSPAKINAVSQQVFKAVGHAKGYVAKSTVTSDGTPDSGAVFSLSVPSANLQRTLIALSQLRGATVVSSTSSSHDITGQVGDAGRRLAEARALEQSLVRQLAAADTAAQVASLKAQIRDANATIARDQGALNGLHSQVQYSRIALTISSSPTSAPGGNTGTGSGFTLHGAGHDAVRVLIVAAGVLLIALAVAVPVALVVALLAWLWLWLRRRRRESVLDRA